MSEERGKEKEEVCIDHFCHKHPLALRVVGRNNGVCYGCWRYINSIETAYVCHEGCDEPRLHEECAEMPREIKLLMHPQHTLIQSQVPYFPGCGVCKREIWCLGYYCGSWDGCGFQIHVGCAKNMEVFQISIPHPSHPQHPLTLLFRPGLSYALLWCDGCGTKDKGESYMCMVCQYLIHDSCAQLSATAQFPHHHHPLSLSYQLPFEYIKYDFKCGICFKALRPKYWVYHCQDCRYVVHIKCAINTTTTNADADADAAEDENIIVFPLKSGFEKVIASFITEVGGVVPNIPNDEIVNSKYKFHDQDHQLHLISSSSLHHQEEDDDENSDDDDDDDDDLNKSELVCDGCTMPIFPTEQQPSDHKYLSCGECNYFLHWACFNLPPQIPSHPLHPHPHHNLTLQTCHKLVFVFCNICHFYTNGLFYKCTVCSFKIDIKCASLPNIIKHKSHPRHHLNRLHIGDTKAIDIYIPRHCNACDDYIVSYDVCYVCDSCNIMLHSSCALLPASVTKRRWDKHELPLTFDASVNHPSSFCCDICEEEMNPKSWMYHCRTCDFSVHPKCFPTHSGYYQNIKFGQQYDFASVHHHPLTYQLLTKKLYCDVCKKRNVYGRRGFQCAEDKCEFSMCGYPCASNRLTEMKAVFRS